MRHRSKANRHNALLALLQEQPFLTDEELSKTLGVSVATIRLDRMELGVPEMRERTRHLAEQASAKPVSMLTEELIGELQQLELGKAGVTVLQIQPNMCFARTGVARGHYLFAQANSLAAALINAPVTLTAAARVRFLRPVHQGEQVTAKATVETDQGTRKLVKVTSFVAERPVFAGQFIVVSHNHT